MLTTITNNCYQWYMLLLSYISAMMWNHYKYFLLVFLNWKLSLMTIDSCYTMLSLINVTSIITFNLKNMLVDIVDNCYQWSSLKSRVTFNLRNMVSNAIISLSLIIAGSNIFQFEKCGIGCYHWYLLLVMLLSTAIPDSYYKQFFYIAINIKWYH